MPRLHSRPLHLLAATVLLAVAAGLPALSMSAPALTPATRPCVILLHGLWRSALSMKHLEWGLEEAGFPVVNEGYPSTGHPIAELAPIAVDAGIAGCVALGRSERLAFVTHSLGGILVREYLSKNELAGLHRVVMLGPPNGGSEMAEYAESAFFLGLFMPQAVAQLGTSGESVPRQLGPVKFELGVIAGTMNYTPFLPGQPEGPSDGTVAVAETLVPGMADFIEMPVGHSFMMWDDAVLAQVISFLEQGRFKRHAPPFISN